MIGDTGDLVKLHLRDDAIPKIAPDMIFTENGQLKQYFKVMTKKGFHF